MSFNLRYNNPDDGENAWPNRKEFVISLIEKYNPDLIGLQEALPEMVEYLSENLAEYVYWGRPRDEDEEDESSGILFKNNIWEQMDGGHFWLSEDPGSEGSKLDGVSLPRMVSWVKLKRKIDNISYHYFNTHYAFENEYIREKETLIFVEQIEKITKMKINIIKNLIISGDFNAIDSEKCIKMWKEYGNLNDTFDGRKDNQENFGTFHGWSGNAGNKRIDYIFVSKEFKILDYQVIKEKNEDRYPSDHFPIISRISN